MAQDTQVWLNIVHSFIHPTHSWPEEKQCIKFMVDLQNVLGNVVDVQDVLICGMKIQKKGQKLDSLVGDP